MEKVCFIVEGPADAVFLSDYLRFLQNEHGLELTDRISGHVKVGHHYSICEDESVIIFIAGGYTALKKLRVKLQVLIDDGYELAVIQDADDAVKDPDYGGYENRLKYLNDLKESVEIDFESFLFPNNSDDGDLETLLLSIARQEKYEPYHECYSTYSNGVRNFSKEIHAEELLERKNLVFNYCQVYHGLTKSKEINRLYELDYWDFNHVSANPLKDFLKGYCVE